MWINGKKNLVYILIYEFQKIINKCLDDVEEEKRKYSFEDLDISYISAIRYRIERLSRRPQPYFATIKDYEEYRLG